MSDTLVKHYLEDSILQFRGMKKLAELETQALESRQSNLFSFNPRMSYPPERWVKADPDFWKPKPAAIKKAPEKPAP